MTCTKQVVSVEDICKDKHAFNDDNYEICKKIIYSMLDIINLNTNLKSLEKELLKLTRRKTGMLRKTDVIHVYRKLIASGELQKNIILWSILQKCKARNISGLSVVTLLLAPFPDDQDFSCKHNCYYCPDESVKNGADADMPRSYLMREPAVQRGFRNGWDAVKQMLDRLDSLFKCGHEVSKLEIILEGGTYTEYPVEYLERFHRDIFWSANTYFEKNKRKPLDLKSEIIINHTAKVPIIGICIETRPDAMNEFWITKFREWGVTRVQLGLQHTDNTILKKVNRGHTAECAVDAIELLKNNCFKIDLHLMPDLPNSNPFMDKKMFDDVFLGDKFQPDQVKIYPCEVTPYTVIEKWYKSGKYIPYCETNPHDLIDVVKYGMEICPPWVRLPRVVRDIPLDYIQSGNMMPNLRQIIDDKFKAEGKFCKDMRTRETGRHQQYKLKDAVYITRKYYASGSWEYFISLESKDEVALFGFIRLRIPPKQHKPLFECLTDMGLIRELHIYGNLVPVGEKSLHDIQHKGVGKMLVNKAEWIAWINGCQGTAIISGEGVKKYYQKLGYNEKQTYMIKSFINKIYYLFLITFVLVVYYIKTL